MKKKRKIHKDKNGREFIKQSYFVGGKQKFHRVYLIDGIPEEEFYEQNASDIDHLMNGDYWLISYEKENSDSIEDSEKQKDRSPDNRNDELPF